MEEESPWSNLGSSLGMGLRDLTDRIEELENRIMSIQRDFISSLEALQRRITRVEEGRPLESVFDVMTQEEVKDTLGVDINKWQDEEEGQASDVRVVKSGFTVVPKEEEGMEIDTSVLDLPDDYGVEEPESVAETPTRLLEKVVEKNEPTVEVEIDWAGVGDPVELSVLNIKDYITDHGGILNQQLKRKNLIPPDADAGFRKRVVGRLVDEGIQVLKVNRLKHFYCSDDDDAEAKHAEVYG